MEKTAPKIVGPRDGKAGFLGSIGVRFMIDGGEAAERFSLVEHPMSPHALAAPLHRHLREDEYSYVIEGRMGALLGDEVVVASAGDLVHKPRNQWHTFWNAGDEPARILEIISPAGFEQFFAELVDLGGVTSADPETLGELCDRYGLEMDPDSVPGLVERFGLRFPGGTPLCPRHAVGSVGRGTHGTPCTRPVRRKRRRGAVAARQPETARAAGPARARRQPHGRHSAARRRLVGRGRARVCDQDGPDLRLAAAQGPAGRRAGDEAPRLRRRRRSRGGRPDPLHAPARRGPGSAGSGRRRHRLGPLPRRSGAVARAGAGRVLRALRPRRGGAPGRAAAGLSRGPHRERPRPRPPRRPRRRARGPGGEAPAARDAARPAHARPLPLRTAGRGALRVRALQAHPGRRARNRAVGSTQGAPASDPQPGPRARACGGHGDGRAARTPPFRRRRGNPLPRPTGGVPCGPGGLRRPRAGAAPARSGPRRRGRRTGRRRAHRRSCRDRQDPPERGADGPGAKARGERAVRALHPDHSIVVGRVRRLRVPARREPLLYFSGRFGHFLPSEQESP